MGDADYIFNGGAAVILKFEEPKQITQQEGEKRNPRLGFEDSFV